MDVATRKRMLSSSLEGPASKIPVPMPEPPTSFADIIFVNTLNALNITEPSQRLPFIEDMIKRLQWVKQYHQQYESTIKKPTPSEKSPIGSPRHPELHRPMDHQQMKKVIEKDREMLQNMSKLIGIAAQGPPILPPAPPPSLVTPKILAPVPPTPEPKAPVDLKKVTSNPSLPVATATVTATSPVHIPVTTPATNGNSAATPKTKKPPVGMKVLSPPPPLPFNPAKQFAQSAEEMMLDIQEKQRKLLSYISAAHGGKVTDEVLHDYLRHPYVLLKENGVTRKQQNPFFHLMAQNVQQMKMMPPMPAVIQKPESSKPTTPIPGPPVLLPQVEIPMKQEIKKESSPFSEKVSPPPQLPLQVPLPQTLFDPTKPFVMPPTRACNQWSVVSMALPLRLLCKCYQNPCRCPQ